MEVGLDGTGNVSRGGLDAQRVQISWGLAHPEWVTPRFTPAALIGIAVLLFLVTTASQNAPGAAVVRSAGYALPLSPVLGWTGVANVLLAPFGAFALNLAAITAAIASGREAHEDPARRSFRCSIPQPASSLSTLRSLGDPRSTQDSLPAGGLLCRAGFEPAGVLREVSSCLYLIESSSPRLRLAHTQ